MEAEHRSVALRLVYAFLPPAVMYPVPGFKSPGLEQQARGWAVELVATAAKEVSHMHPDLDVQTSLDDGSPADVLYEHSRGAALTVVGAAGSHQLTNAVLGSVAARVAARALSPIVVVRQSSGETAPLPGAPVIVGVDGSDDAQRAIGLAFDEAALRGVGLIAVHCWEDQPIRRIVTILPRPDHWAEVEADEHRLLAEQVAGWADKYPDVRVTRHVVEGHAAECLMYCAQGAIDGVVAQLVLVGSRGRGGFKGLLLGSTSAALLAHSPCSVMVVRDS